MSEFDIQIDKAFADEVEGELLTVKRVIALQALSGVTDNMPVLTGRARGNTIVSVGQADTSFSDTEDPDGSQAKGNGGSVIAADQDPFAAVFVQNNLPYINVIEYGFENRAPAAPFALTFATIQAQFK